MSGTFQATQGITAFFDDIAPFADALTVASFAYVGRRLPDGRVEVLKGRLRFMPLESTPPARVFSSGEIVAEDVPLSELGTAPETLLRSLVEGNKFQTQHAQLYFSALAGASASLASLHAEGLVQQQKLSVLTIRGDKARPMAQPDTDWSLKASNPPYDSLQELLGDFGLGVLEAETSIEIFAGSVLALDFYSPVDGSDATPTIRASRFLDKSAFSLGVREVIPNGATTRFVMAADAIQWAPHPELAGVVVGTTKLTVTPGALLCCYVNYRGVTLSFGWIGDPKLRPNIDRTVIEVFDPNLEAISELSQSVAGTRNSLAAQNLEAAVSAILWMLGFAVVQIGGNPRTSDAVDLIARTPEGHYVLVECTTGTLKYQSKLANLQSRAVQVRKRLDKANATANRVLPVICTSLSREEVKSEADEAERSGIGVFCREDIDAALTTRTSLPSNADTLFKELEAHLAEVQTSG